MNARKFTHTRRLVAAPIAIIILLMGILISIFPTESMFFVFVIALLLTGIYDCVRGKMLNGINFWCVIGGIITILFAILIGLKLLGLFSSLSVFELIFPIWGIIYGLTRLLAGYVMFVVEQSSDGVMITIGILLLIGGLCLLILPSLGILTMIQIVGMISGALLLLTAIQVIIDCFVW